MSKYFLLTVVAGGIIICDQSSKYVVQQLMSLHDSIEVISGFFNLTYIQNPGAAFGLFGNSSDTLRVVLLVGVSLFALIILFFMYVKEEENDILVLVAIAMIIGGAAGNLIDRLRLNRVVDFFDFYWRGHHWPAFNVADSAITVGTVILMLTILFSGRKNILKI